MRPAAKVKRQYFKVTQFLGFEDTLFHNSVIINFPLEYIAILGTEKKNYRAPTVYIQPITIFVIK